MCRTIGPYRILETIASGGWGDVHRAEDPKTGRQVAVKTIRDIHSTGPRALEAVERFRREIDLLARLDHPNVVKFLGHGDEVGILYFVMEYVEGVSLESRVQGGRLTTREAFEYFLQAARGVEHLHKLRIVHRDIKPLNLLLSNDRIVVVDLGLGRLFAPTDATSSTYKGITGPRDVRGSFPYMSPEQFDDFANAKEPADVYALGCTLHFLLTGRPPYDETVDWKIIEAHRRNPIPSISRECVGVCALFDKLFSAMLAKDPEDRPPNASVLVREVLECWDCPNHRQQGTASEGNLTRLRAATHIAARRLELLSHLQSVIRDVVYWLDLLVWDTKHDPAEARPWEDAAAQGPHLLDKLAKEPIWLPKDSCLGREYVELAGHVRDETDRGCHKLAERLDDHGRFSAEEFRHRILERSGDLRDRLMEYQAQVETRLKELCNSIEGAARELRV